MAHDGVDDPAPVAAGGVTRKGQATRSRIIRTAADLMHRRGVAATGIDDVRREARVSGSQMTHYFPDKRSLVRAVIAHQLQIVVTFHGQHDLGKLDSFSALRRWADLNVEALADRNAEGGCVFGSLVGALAELDPAWRADLAAGYEQWGRLLRAGLAAMKRRGELRREAKPDVLATVLLAAHQGGYLLSQTQRDARPLRDALNAALIHVHSYAAEGIELPPARRRAASARLRAEAGPGVGRVGKGDVEVRPEAGAPGAGDHHSAAHGRPAKPIQAQEPLQ
jgi:AcrR family transcriptional regulator